MKAGYSGSSKTGPLSPLVPFPFFFPPWFSYRPTVRGNKLAGRGKKATNIGRGQALSGGCMGRGGAWKTLRWADRSGELEEVKKGGPGPGAGLPFFSSPPFPPWWVRGRKAGVKEKNAEVKIPTAGRFPRGTLWLVPLLGDTLLSAFPRPLGRR